MVCLSVVILFTFSSPNYRLISWPLSLSCVCLTFFVTRTHSPTVIWWSLSADPFLSKATRKWSLVLRLWYLSEWKDCVVIQGIVLMIMTFVWCSLSIRKQEGWKREEKRFWNESCPQVHRRTHIMVCFIPAIIQSKYRKYLIPNSLLSHQWPITYQFLSIIAVSYQWPICYWWDSHDSSNTIFFSSLSFIITYLNPSS